MCTDSVGVDKSDIGRKEGRRRLTQETGTNCRPLFGYKMTSLQNLDQNFHLYDCVYPFLLKETFQKNIYVFEGISLGIFFF